MCTNPRLIYNPSRVLCAKREGLFLRVPCGKCDECRNAKTDEWLIRLLHEYEAYTSSGGKVLFPTLTYNNKHLPYIPDFVYHDVVGYDSDGYPITNDKKVSCFSGKDKSRFIMKIRKHFERLGFSGKDYPIKYMVCSEFGSNKLYKDDRGHYRKGTNRPHYHVLLFFPRDIIVNFTEDYILSQVQKAWSVRNPQSHKLEWLGEVRYSKDDYGIPRPWVAYDAAIRYATKYCVKDMDYFDNPGVRSFLETKFKDSDPEERAHLSKLLAKHYQSKNLGSCLLDSLTFQSYIDGLDISRFGNFKRGSTYRYPVPYYYRRKPLNREVQISIDYKDEPVFKTTLNSKGIEVKRALLHKNLRSFADKWYRTISQENILKVFRSDDKCFEVTAFSSTELSNYLRKLVPDYNCIKEFYLYTSILAKQNVSTKSIEFVEHLDHNSYINFAMQFFDRDFDPHDITHIYVDEKGVSASRHYHPQILKDRVELCNLERFQPYVRASLYLNKIQFYDRRERHKAYKKQLEDNKKFRNETKKY